MIATSSAKSQRKRKGRWFAVSRGNQALDSFPNLTCHAWIRPSFRLNQWAIGETWAQQLNPTLWGQSFRRALEKSLAPCAVSLHFRGHLNAKAKNIYACVTLPPLRSSRYWATSTMDQTRNHQLVQSGFPVAFLKCIGQRLPSAQKGFGPSSLK